MDAGDDMLTAMARELVTQKGIGERAEGVWKAMQVHYPQPVSAVFPVQPVQAEESGVERELVAATTTGMTATQPCLFGEADHPDPLRPPSVARPARKRTQQRSNVLPNEQLRLGF